MATKSSGRMTSTLKVSRAVKTAPKHPPAVKPKLAPEKVVAGGKRRSQPPKANATSAAASSKLPTPSKQSQLIALLRRGASISQMMSFTGWQAHTVRGTISGVLRKKLGLKVSWEFPAGSTERVYRIVNASQA